MSNDPKSRTVENASDDTRHGRRSTDNPDNDPGQRSLQNRETDPTTDAADPEGGGTGDPEPPTFEDGVDVFTGVEATAAYHRAVSDHDDDEQTHQMAEHYVFIDKDIEEYGNF